MGRNLLVVGGVPLQTPPTTGNHGNPAHVRDSGAARALACTRDERRDPLLRSGSPSRASASSDPNNLQTNESSATATLTLSMAANGGRPGRFTPKVHSARHGAVANPRPDADPHSARMIIGHEFGPAYGDAHLAAAEPLFDRGLTPRPLSPVRCRRQTCSAGRRRVRHWRGAARPVRIHKDNWHALESARWGRARTDGRARASGAKGLRSQTLPDYANVQDCIRPRAHWRSVPSPHCSACAPPGCWTSTAIKAARTEVSRSKSWGDHAPPTSSPTARSGVSAPAGFPTTRPLAFIYLLGAGAALHRRADEGPHLRTIARADSRSARRAIAALRGAGGGATVGEARRDRNRTGFLSQLRQARRWLVRHIRG